MREIRASRAQLPGILRHELRAGGRTQAAFCRRYGHDKAYVSRMLLGKTAITTQFMWDFAEYLQVALVLMPTQRSY